MGCSYEGGPTDIPLVSGHPALAGTGGFFYRRPQRNLEFLKGRDVVLHSSISPSGAFSSLGGRHSLFDTNELEGGQPYAEEKDKENVRKQGKHGEMKRQRS